MLMPKRTKHRKEFKPKLKDRAKRGTNVAFGEFGLQATTKAYVNARQIEAARIAMTRFMKRDGQVWIKIFPSRPQTKKPLEVRMGSGKGNVEAWITPVEPGRVMFEVAGVSEDVAKEALRLASHKLPVKTKIIRNSEYKGDE
ncbi:MAG: 50S ribosomal protein L16 [Mycoplasmatales bacterium]